MSSDRVNPALEEIVRRKLGQRGATSNPDPPRGVNPDMTVPTTHSFSVLGLPKLWAWYDASQIVAHSDGDAIAQFADLSGNARHLLQSTASLRPLYKKSIQNGLPILRADGVDDFMRLAATGVVLSQPLTVVSVYASSDVTKRPYDSSNSGLVLSEYGNAGVWMYNAGTQIASGTAVDSNFHAHACVFNGVSSFLILDGTTIATGLPGSDGLDGLTVFGNRLGSPTVSSGDYGELFIYGSGDLATAQEACRSMKGKWSTP